MKYLLLIYGNQEKWASIPAEDWPEAIAKQDAFNRKYQATGELIGAYGLADAAAARLVRRENGQLAVTDGPYLETKEYCGSWPAKPGRRPPITWRRRGTRPACSNAATWPSRPRGWGPTGNTGRQAG
jgi:hypothetical protein